MRDPRRLSTAFWVDILPKVWILGLYVYPKGKRTAGTFARHAGPADPPHADLWPAARAGHWARHSADVRGRTAGRARGPLPRAPTPGRARLDRGRVGDLREQPQGSLLHAHATGPQTSRQGNNQVAATGGGHRQGSGARGG